jgi:hypothetical protein
MRKILTLTILAIFLTGCGGGTVSNSTTSNNSNAKPATNSNSTTNSETKSADTTIVMLDYDKLSKLNADEISKFKGRTVASKGTLQEWTTGSLKVAIGGTTAFCKGDFVEYKEAIELFGKNKKEVKISFRGTLDDVDSGFGDLKMNDCVITDMEK